MTRIVALIFILAAAIPALAVRPAAGLEVVQRFGTAEIALLGAARPGDE